MCLTSYTIIENLSSIYECPHVCDTKPSPNIGFYIYKSSFQVKFVGVSHLKI